MDGITAEMLKYGEKNNGCFWYVTFNGDREVLREVEV